MPFLRFSNEMTMTSTTKAKINDATMTTIVELCNCAKVGQDTCSTSSLYDYMM